MIYTLEITPQKERSLLVSEAARISGITNRIGQVITAAIVKDSILFMDVDFHDDRKYKEFELDLQQRGYNVKCPTPRVPESKLEATAAGGEK